MEPVNILGAPICMSMHSTRLVDTHTHTHRRTYVWIETYLNCNWNTCRRYSSNQPQMRDVMASKIPTRGKAISEYQITTTEMWSSARVISLDSWLAGWLADIQVKLDFDSWYDCHTPRVVCWAESPEQTFVLVALEDHRLFIGRVICFMIKAKWLSNWRETLSTAAVVFNRPGFNTNTK